MPRPAAERLTPHERIDLSPAQTLDVDSILISLGTIVHWSDSAEVRRWIMESVGFPLDDVRAFLVVNHLAYRGALSPTELSKILGTGRPNMTKIVGRLERSDLVTRTANPDDDRGVLIALTRYGREIGEQIVMFGDARMRESLENWTESDRAQLRELLKRLAARAEADGYRVRPHA